MRKQGIDLRLLLSLLVLVLVAGGVALLDRRRLLRRLQRGVSGASAKFEAAGTLYARARRAAARAAQLPRPAGQHRLLSRQGRARDVPLHELPRHLPADHLEPARRAEPDGCRDRVQSTDHRRLRRPQRRHAGGRRRVPGPSRDDRPDAVPGRLRARTRRRLEGLGRRLRTRREPAAVRQPLGARSTGSPARGSG